MNPSLWLPALAWLGAYLALALGHDWVKGWVVARMQDRRTPGVRCPPTGAPSTVHVLAALAALLGGAAIPLSGPMRWGDRLAGLHLFADAETGLLLVLAATWTAVVLLSTLGDDGAFQAGSGRRRVGAVLPYAVPTLLVVSSLVIAHGAASQGAGANLRLTDVIGSQARWNALGWLAITQPVALIVWLACAPGHRPGTRARSRARSRIAWQWVALDRDLLTTALFFGGWRGPFVERWPVLGLVYTALKVAALAVVHAWVAASIRPAGAERRTQRVWFVYVPLAALNLLLTVAIVVLR